MLEHSGSVRLTHYLTEAKPIVKPRKKYTNTITFRIPIPETQPNSIYKSLIRFSRYSTKYLILKSVNSIYSTTNKTVIMEPTPK